MPKIPLYNQGLGQTVTTRPIQGIRANEGAFTAAQKGFSAFGKSIEDAAFQFGMEEKKAETERYRNKINTEVNQEMNNFTMSSEATTVAEYQALADKKRQELRNKHLSGLEGKLTKSQFSAVSMQFDNTFAAKVATGSQMAHAKGQQIRTDQVNTTIEDTLSQLRSLDPSSQLYQDIQANLDAGFDRWASQGLAPKYSKTTYRRELSASRFVSDIEKASSQADIDKLRSQVTAERGDMTAADFAARNTAIDAQEKITDAMQVDAAFETIIENKPDATDEQLAEGVQTIRDGKVLTITTNAGEDVVVDFGTMKPSNRAMLIARIEAKNKSDKAEALSANKLAAKEKFRGTNSLEELRLIRNQFTQKGDDGKYLHFPDVTTFEGRQAIEGLLDRELAEKAVRVVAETSRDMDDVNARIVQNDGIISSEDSQLIASAKSKLVAANLIEESIALQDTVDATMNSSVLFKEIEFASASEQAQTMSAASRYTDANGKKTYELLQNRMAVSREAMQKDFVGYYLKSKKIDPDGEQPTAKELLNIQMEMGIPPSDARVTSNAQLRSFSAQYKAAEVQDKGQIMDQFLAQFPNNEDRVMKHLVETNIISLVDSVVNAYPNNANMSMVLDANSEAGQKLINDKSLISGEDINTINELAAETMADYGQSILGRFIDETRGGGNSSRVFHHLGMRKIVQDTAAWIRASDRTKSHQEAVDIAYNAVIGNNFIFPEVNGTKLRLPKKYEGAESDISLVLEGGVNLNRDMLAAKIEFPPPMAGQTVQQANEQYLNDLEAEGTWRTTTDGTGVYLVDQTGNMVRMRRGTGAAVAPSPTGPMKDFVTVSFDEVRSFGAAMPDTIKGTSALAKKRRREFYRTRNLF